MQNGNASASNRIHQDKPDSRSPLRSFVCVCCELRCNTRRCTQVEGALSFQECDALIAATEDLGYKHQGSLGAAHGQVLHHEICACQIDHTLLVAIKILVGSFRSRVLYTCSPPPCCECLWCLRALVLCLLRACFPCPGGCLCFRFLAVALTLCSALSVLPFTLWL